jgi:hypothetical protein
MKKVCHRIALSRRTFSLSKVLLAGFVTPSLFLLASCGGATSSSSSLSQPQTPTTQPPAPSGSGTQTSDPSQSGGSSGSSGSTSNSTNSNNNNDGVPANATVQQAIQTLPDWQWCTAKLNGKPCASGLGNATSTLTQDQQAPSLSGESSEFTLGGKTQYSNALWWKSFGPDSTPTHFVYDVYFYMDDPNLPEALEFDTNQSMNGTRYTWGTECSYRNTGYWDIWNPESERWETTTVPCPVVSAKTWHHLTWKVERVNGQVHYISVTLDGNVSTVNKYYNPQQNYGGNDLNVAFQMDGDYRQDPYSVWLDNFSLSCW